ncbi:MAG: hypothetical protein ACTSQP_24305 [Promethearchaeota archaeon]
MGKGNLTLIFGLLGFIPFIGLIFSILAIVFYRVGKDVPGEEKRAKTGFKMGIFCTIMYSIILISTISILILILPS